MARLMGVPFLLTIVLVGLCRGETEPMVDPLTAPLNDSCENRNCTDMLHNPADYFNASSDRLSDVCNFKAEVSQCLSECGPRPNQLSPTEAAISEILDFVCDESRRDVMERVVAAPCFQDQDRIKAKVSNYTMQCMTSFARNSRMVAIAAAMAGRNPIAALCPSLRVSIRCIAIKVGEDCGQFVVQPLIGMVNLMFRHVMPQYGVCWPRPNVVMPSYRIAKRSPVSAADAAAASAASFRQLLGVELDLNVL